MADRLAALRDLECLLKNSIDACPVDKIAPLVAQYRGTLEEIAGLAREAGEVVDPVDEISARRSARGGATARNRGTAGSAG